MPAKWLCLNRGAGNNGSRVLPDRNINMPLASIPIESIIVATFVVVMFAALMAALAWGVHQSG
jgi:hypothetical protein